MARRFLTTSSGSEPVDGPEGPDGRPVDMGAGGQESNRRHKANRGDVRAAVVALLAEKPATPSTTRR